MDNGKGTNEQYLEILSSWKVEKSVFEKKSIQFPGKLTKRAPTMRMCGVPLEQQENIDGCCNSVVTNLVDEIWMSNSLTQELNCETKQNIIDLITLRCMQPPGMTTDDLKIMISEEIGRTLEL